VLNITDEIGPEALLEIFYVFDHTVPFRRKEWRLLYEWTIGAVFQFPTRLADPPFSLFPVF
jgi:hypothetical protein